MTRLKHTFRLPSPLSKDLADYAARKRVPQALVVETALSSFLSPDGSERLESALVKRLDTLTRRMERIERHVTIGNEALGLFVRFWLTQVPPAADAGDPAAQAQGRARYERFIDAVGQRLAKGQSLAADLTEEVAGDANFEKG